LQNLHNVIELVRFKISRASALKHACERLLLLAALEENIHHGR